MNHDWLLVMWDSGELIWRMAEKEAVRLESAYQERGIYRNRYVREAILTLGLPGKRRMYNKALCDFDGTILLFDAMLHEDFVKWIMEHNPKARIIFWYWNNKNGYRLLPDRLHAMGCEVWSFNEHDCQSLGLHYNTQFFCPSFFGDIAEQNRRSEPEHDVVFIGRNKGRSSEIEDYFRDAGKVKFYSYYVYDNIFDFEGRRKKLHAPLSYREYLEMELRGRAILDWAASENAGLSLRVMEAIYFRRKLITNNESIQNFDFYHPDNVFLVGKDSKQGLKAFLDKPYYELAECIRDKYSFSEWLKRFDSESIR